MIKSKHRHSKSFAVLCVYLVFIIVNGFSCVIYGAYVHVDWDNCTEENSNKNRFLCGALWSLFYKGHRFRIRNDGRKNTNTRIIMMQSEFIKTTWHKTTFHNQRGTNLCLFLTSIWIIIIIFAHIGTLFGKISERVITCFAPFTANLYECIEDIICKATHMPIWRLFCLFSLLFFFLLLRYLLLILITAVHVYGILLNCFLWKNFHFVISICYSFDDMVYDFVMEWPSCVELISR